MSAHQSPPYIAFSPRRVAALVLRHWYVIKSSWPRIFDLMYWPLLQMVIWGFINTFLATQSSWVLRAGGLFIGAVLLWDVLVRGQFGMTLSLLEEMWSRNFAHLFVAPLRPFEYAIALMGLSVVRSLVGVVPAALLAIPLFLLAGLVMSEADITPRISKFADALVGRIAGSLAMVMVISCMFFGAISGSGLADVTAIGSLMLPAMDKQGYRKGLSASLLGCAGSLGTVIPPSIVMIILGVTTGTSIGKLYLGGFVPGVFTGLCLLALAWVYATRMNLPPGAPFSLLHDSRSLGKPVNRKLATSGSGQRPCWLQPCGVCLRAS